MFSRNTFLMLVLLVAWTGQGALAFAQNTPKNPTQKAGNYAVELRVPAEGLFAEEEIDIEFRVTDTSKEDPVQGAAPVVRAKVTAKLTMPSMSSMPNAIPKTHAEGVPGDYGVVCFFPHGGEYQIDLTIAPPEEKPFTVSFRVPVRDFTKNRKPKPKPYTLEVRSNPITPRAGEPAELTITVRSRETKQPVTDFDIVHEQLMHFIIVSKDLSQFAHEHPELGQGGKFTLKFTFPTGGEYRLFADIAPRNAGSQVIMQPFQVSGPKPVAVALRPAPPEKSEGGVRAALTTPANQMLARRALDLRFTLKSEANGEPVTDLQPWLGAIAHLILIHEDGTTFVHSHPDESDPRNGRTGNLTFMARFPKTGFYKGWLQFQRAGQICTIPFVVAASEAIAR